MTADNLNVDRSKYSLMIIPPVSTAPDTRIEPRSPAPLRFKLGSPIHIRWTAPVGHSRRDWIGLYRVIDVEDRLVTKIASRGKWLPVCRAEYDDGRSASIISEEEDKNGAKGEVVFTVNVLVWRCGVYEARYHHDGYTHGL